MKKILIVDDYVTIRKIYKDRLMAEGFEVTEADSVSLGIAKIFEKEDIDLVLLDINMPGKNGGELMRVIQDYDVSFKVIVCSSYSIEEQKKLIPNADGYFDKGQGIQILIQKVKNALS